jgi:hypothetical protein
MKRASHEHCNAKRSRGRCIRAAAQPRVVAAARRLRKRTQTENASGFNATVTKGRYGRVRKAAAGHAAQNEAEKANSFNGDLILAPPLPSARNALICHAPR